MWLYLIGMNKGVFNIKHPAMLGEARQQMLWTLPYKIPMQVRKANQIWK